MEITLATFKKLLHSIKDRNIALKVRTHTGWSKDYLHIIGFIASVNDQKANTFGGIVLSNTAETEGVLINNISTISAFELAETIEHYQAGKVYFLRDHTSLKSLH
jgi:hypothetical protein